MWFNYGYRISELVRSSRVNETKSGLIRTVLSIWNSVYRHIDSIALKQSKKLWDHYLKGINKNTL